MERLQKDAEQARDGNADERVRLNLELSTGVAIPLSLAKKIMRFEWVPIVCVVAVLQSCNSKDQEGSTDYPTDWLSSHTDYGDSIHEAGRPSEWKSDRIELGYSNFTVSIGPYFYRDEDNDDPDYYTIDVEFDHDEGSMVVFERQLPLSVLPANYTELKASDVVSYDPETRTVKFSIGEERFTYQIPPPRNR